MPRTANIATIRPDGIAPKLGSQGHMAVKVTKTEGSYPSLKRWTRCKNLIDHLAHELWP
jgi:hypothetical protein